MRDERARAFFPSNFISARKFGATRRRRRRDYDAVGGCGAANGRGVCGDAARVVLPRCFTRAQFCFYFELLIRGYEGRFDFSRWWWLVNLAESLCYMNIYKGKF